MQDIEHKGFRFNEGKLRYDLIHPFAEKQLVRVLSLGASKYAPRNWENGLSWTQTIASLKRHLAAIEAGEDFDPETGLLHAAHVQANAHFLTAFYQIYPQGDDRPHAYLKPRRIGLDIDDVLADWVTTWCHKHGNDIPSSWQFDRAIVEKFDKMKYDGSLDEFYLNLPVKSAPAEIPFEPACYVTSRPVDVKVTEKWLDDNGFPAAPVFSLGLDGDKVAILKEQKVDIFVDDRYDNFVKLNNAGICCYLFTAPHNLRYDVGHKRINSLAELSQV